MKHFYLIFLLSTTQAFCQQTSDWLNSLENPRDPFFHGLKPDNQLTNYLSHDLSELLKPRTEFLGYIGDDFRRIEVTFTSITQNENIPNQYFVSGKTTVFKNTCDFEGTITFEQFREFKNMNYGLDSMYANSGFKAQGIAIGKYLFSENAKQNHVGIFEGIMTLWWYVDKNGQIQYDNLSPYSDSYKNNQYIGIWSEYGKNSERPCNWGERRIPFSGDLDIGAGEFSVNPRYRNKGWEALKKSEIGESEGAVRINEN
ncbi:hypothetical protein [Ekhidna sp.]|uniref:hypothetical protein n=1 Tax=Ekhidna sp. TaxID=2608089 RepID=UPI003298C1E9